MSARPEAPPAVCRFLRSKGAGVVYGQPVRWEHGFYSSAVFWCLITAESVGPDDSFVHPHVCTANRPCFRALPRDAADPAFPR
jgi:hypothetical protein